MTLARTCWCGNTSLERFSPTYLRCANCETLISDRQAGSEITRVDDEQDSFYGRNYWFEHQESVLGQPDIVTRARSDLTERCLHWLRGVLKYKLPPGQVLEIGSAHGGFVAFLRQVGFDATGLELSPWIAQFARDTFAVPMLVGPIEQQDLASASFALVAAMDVLEHLPNPLQTFEHITRVLDPSGVLMIQTPCYPEGSTFEELRDSQDPFLQHLWMDEHLFLFSRKSVRAFLERVGIIYVEFEPAIFAQYDMFLVAGRRRITANSYAAIERALSQSPGGRFMEAMLDQQQELRGTVEKLSLVEIDRTARLERINVLTKRLAESEEDRAARLDRIDALTNRLAESEEDRAARLDRIDVLTKQLAETRSDSVARLDTINLLTERLSESEADRAARLRLIEGLSSRNEELETDRAARLEKINILTERVAELQSQQASQTRLIEAQSNRIESQLAPSLEDGDLERSGSPS
jgi:SAM-dependent methyltransferase